MSNTHGPENMGDEASHSPFGTVLEDGGSTLSTARFLLHFKQHGLTYAIVALLAEQAGILQMLMSTAGGMC